MAILRYTASADNTIVNAYQPNLTTRGTGSNAGQADVLETYSIYGRQQASSSATSGSQELSRILIKFPITDITADRSAGKIPASGSVNFYLKVYNAETSKTVPRNYALEVLPIAQDWQEGSGLDLENYSDLTRGNIGSNWMSASNSSQWLRPDGEQIIGGSYLTGASDPQFKQTFASGLEDLEIDISPLVEHWIAGTKDNYGVGIMLSSSYEAYYSASNDEGYDPYYTGSILNNTGGATTSYYTKRFFGRGTQYFFKKPIIEARWDSVTRDDRGDFYFSSSLAPGPDNLNTLYLYNYVRGKLTNIPAIGSTGSIMVSLYSGSSDNSQPSEKLTLYNGATAVTGGFVSTGIYSCSIAITGTLSDITTLYDVWFSGSGEDPSTNNTEFYTGSISAKAFSATSNTREPVYFINITNLQNRYSPTETARFNLYVRNKNWNPTIYTKAVATPEHVPIVSASYRVVRIIDALEAVPHNTGSDFATGLSYDVSGNYFDFNMKLLEPGYEYGFKFAFYDDELSSWLEQDKIFKFRVAGNEY
jgi:hypothetical protein